MSSPFFTMFFPAPARPCAIVDLVGMCGMTLELDMNHAEEGICGFIPSYLSYLETYRKLAPKTIHEYRDDLALFVRFLRQRGMAPFQPDDISRQVMLEYAQTMTQAPATVWRRLSTVSSFFNYLQDTGKALRNPARGIPRPKRRKSVPKALTSIELSALLMVAEYPWHRAAILILCGTGLRIQELCDLRLSDVDMDIGALCVLGKGNKERVVPLSTDVMAAIRWYLPRRRAHVGVETLLVNTEGNPVKPPTFRLALNRLAERAGLEPKRIHPHAFRHTFATDLVRNHVDIHVVQELLGHETIATTALYLSADTQEKRAAVETLSIGGQRRV